MTRILMTEWSEPCGRKTNSCATRFNTSSPTLEIGGRKVLEYIAVEQGCLHGNSHFARQFRCFTRQNANCRAKILVQLVCFVCINLMPGHPAKMSLILHRVFSYSTISQKPLYSTKSNNKPFQPIPEIPKIQLNQFRLYKFLIEKWFQYYTIKIKDRREKML